MGAYQSFGAMEEGRTAFDARDACVSLSASWSQLVPYRSLPSLLPFDFEQEERG